MEFNDSFTAKQCLSIDKIGAGSSRNVEFCEDTNLLTYIIGDENTTQPRDSGNSSDCSLPSSCVDEQSCPNSTSSRLSAPASLQASSFNRRLSEKLSSINCLSSSGIGDDEDVDIDEQDIGSSKPEASSGFQSQKNESVSKSESRPQSLLEDDRVLKNLLNLEDYYRVHSNYFLYLQTEVKPWMRKVLASWMLDVCNNQSCADDVFILAMNILDRFLSIQPIGKRHLQLLGTVCMFIASKLRSSITLNAETLAIYTANSINIEDLLNWEQLVLQKLRWDICSITPNDFLPHLLNKLGLFDLYNNNTQFRKAIQSKIAQCATDFRFSILPPSMIASGCLIASLTHESLEGQFSASQVAQFKLNLNTVTGIDLECLNECLEQIEMFANSASAPSYQSSTGQTEQTTTVESTSKTQTNTKLNNITNISNNQQHSNSSEFRKETNSSKFQDSIAAGFHQNENVCC